MKKLAEKIARHIYDNDNGIMSDIADRMIAIGREDFVLKMIRDQAMVAPNRVKAILGDKLFDEMMNHPDINNI